VSACLNVSADHLGLKGIDTLEQLAELKRVVVEVAQNTAVLNADDDLCLKMADYTQADHVCYVTMNPAHALVKEHIRAGGRAMVLEQGINGDMITLYDKGTHYQLVWTHQIPATMDGKATHNVQNAMFAAALAYSLDKSLDDIRHGLRSFNSTIFQAPGRMNVFDEHPFRVILDYGHNAAAIHSISQLVDRLDVAGRRICVLAAPGDRRDEDIRAIADEASGHFDYFICRADDRRRGRGDDEVPQMLRDQLLVNGVDVDAVEIIPDEIVSVATALEMAKEGDLVVLFADDVRRSWNQVIHYEADSEMVAAADSAKPANSFVEEDPEAFSLDAGARLIKDERGVRLARDEESGPGRRKRLKIELLDSRRLTGPNLFWDWPGAVLDISLSDIPADLVISAWAEEVTRLMDAMGWNTENIDSREFDGGVSLIINAPIDVLYTACELNEVAFNRATTWLSGETPADLEQVVVDLSRQREEERNPALLALQQAALDHHVPFLWDDDEVSVGFGKTAIVWPATQLPSPETVNWDEVSSIPLGIVTGTNGKSTTVRLAASILAAAGLRAGITSTDYIRVGEEILDRGDYSGPGGARTLLRHPQSEAVVLEVARGGLLRRGIGVERADGALVTNVAADHLGEYGINSVAEMAEAKFIVRRALSADAPLILNADDPESVALAATLSNRIIWFGLHADKGVIQQRLQDNGTVAFLKEGWLMLAEEGEARRIAEAKEVPITFGGVARYNISNALGAMALCHVLGADDQALGAGLKAFSGAADVNPGRGNLFEKDGVRIFLDFQGNQRNC